MLSLHNELYDANYLEVSRDVLRRNAKAVTDYVKTRVIGVLKFDGYFLSIGAAGGYEVILSTDEKRFGGHGRVDMDHRYYSYKMTDGRTGFTCYLPNRSAVVFRKMK